MKLNQAVTTNPLMFDPIGKTAKFEAREGFPYISYVEEEPAVKICDNEDVAFVMYAQREDCVGEVRRRYLSQNGIRNQTGLSVSQMVRRRGTSDAPQG